jgi:hypothetical protein
MSVPHINTFRSAFAFQTLEKLQFETELCVSGSNFETRQLFLLTGVLHVTNNVKYICLPFNSAMLLLLSQTGPCNKYFQTLYHTMSARSDSIYKTFFLTRICPHISPNYLHRLRPQSWVPSCRLWAVRCDVHNGLQRGRICLNPRVCYQRGSEANEDRVSASCLTVQSCLFSFVTFFETYGCSLLACLFM